MTTQTTGRGLSPRTRKWLLFLTVPAALFVLALPAAATLFFVIPIIPMIVPFLIWMFVRKPEWRAPGTPTRVQKLRPAHALG